MADLDSISISPAKNGGFSVKHSYKPKPTYKKGANGGFGVEYNAPEEHVFGPKEHAALVAHISKALKLREAPEEAAEAKAEAAGTRRKTGDKYVAD